MRSILSAILFLSLAFSTNAAGPRSWNKSGTATTSNATLTVGGSTPFGPAAVCVSNTGDTNSLYFDWTDGVATTTDNSTNQVVPPSMTICYSNLSKNVVNVMQIGVITASSTTTYVFNAIAFN